MAQIYPIHTHTFQHSHHSNSIGYTIKISKIHLKGARHYTHPPPKFSLNCDRTNKGYLCIKETNPNTLNLYIFVGNLEYKMGKEGHYSQQALKHVQLVHQVSVPVTKNVTNISH